MLRSLKFLFCALALVAIAHAQVFGVYRNYVCELGGELVETVADHHHAGDDLELSHFVDYKPHHHGHGHEHGREDPANAPHDDAGNDAEPHAPLKVDLNALQLAGPVAIPMFASVLLCELPGFLAVIPVRSAAEEHVVVPPPDEAGGLSPPACLLVADCMVILV